MKEIDLNQPALQLIKIHGAGASMEATQMADKMRARNDLIGLQTWTQIMSIIRQLEQKEQSLRSLA